MTPAQREKLETALGITEPLPWPASLDEEIVLAERRMEAEAHGPARIRRGSEVARVFALLDQIESERTGSR